MEIHVRSADHRNPHGWQQDPAGTLLEPNPYVRFRFAAFIFLATSMVAGTAVAAGEEPAKPPTKKAVAAKGKKKSAKAAPKTSTQPALTAEQLGLGDIKLSDVKAAEQGQTKPQEAPPPPAPVVAPPPAPPPPPPAPPPSLEITQKDKVIAPKATPRKHISIEVNPIPMIAGRYGGNVEYVPFVHHALTASVFYQTFSSQTLGIVMPKAVDTSAGAQARLGGEVGYRFYSGHIGPNGFFAGASGVATPLALPRVRPDLHTEVVSFQTFGAAVDIGAQWVSDWGITIGAGIGGMYLFYDAPKSAALPAGAPSISVPQPHILPRVLLAAGWSF
jgi:hypothetical protein